MTFRISWILAAWALGGLVPVLAQDLPAPTGPAAVGTMVFEWSDSSRAEVVEFLAPDTGTRRLAPAPPRGGRTTVVQAWYPAASASGGSSTVAPYNPDIEAFVPAIGDTARIALYRSVRTHAGWNAPLAPGGKLPVLLFSPGSGVFRADYTSLYEDLASHGYLVVAVSHPGITLMSLHDGRLATEWRGWRPPPGLSMSLDRDSLRASMEFYAKTRDTYASGDIRFVLDRLIEMNRGAEGGALPRPTRPGQNRRLRALNRRCGCGRSGPRRSPDPRRARLRCNPAADALR